MSAYLEPAAHFDALATFATRHRSGLRRPIAYTFGGERRLMTEAASVAAILRDQNVRSVAYRYDDASRAEPYTYRRVNIDNLSPADVVMACNGLKYQSCETPDYAETEAHAILQAIREDAIRCLVEHSECWSITPERLNPPRPAALASR